MVKNDFLWRGGCLWLDFVNTERMRAGERVDLLDDEPGAMVDWLCASECVPAAVAQQAAAWATAELEELGATAKSLRKTLRDICDEFQAHGAVPPQLIVELNQYLAPPAPGLRLETRDEGQFELLTAWGEATIHQLLFPIAQNAAETLRAGQLPRVHQCAGAICILWFLDTSKNGQRRWCSMETCGNRHKVFQHNLRKKN